MEELTNNLKILINKTMERHIKNPHSAPTADELLKIADAVTQYDHATRIRPGYLKDQSELIGYIQHELEDLRATPTSSDEDDIPDDGSQDYAIGYEDGKIGGQIIALEQLLQHFEAKSTPTAENHERRD